MGDFFGQSRDSNHVRTRRPFNGVRSWASRIFVVTMFFLREVAVKRMDEGVVTGMEFMDVGC